MADEKSRLKSTERTIRRRVEFEERAFHIVNKLIDGCFDGEYLSECGKRISPANYDDIVEERAISMVCGYPVCDESLPNVPKKKYHISTKTNRVYDISERKNFCSNQCFKASKYFRQQIPESPVWNIEEENIKIVVSPHKSVPGLVGDEVIGEIPRSNLQKELEELNDMDKKSVRNNNKNSRNDILSSSIERQIKNVSINEKDAMAIPDVVCKESDNVSTGAVRDDLSFEVFYSNFTNINLDDFETESSVSDSTPADKSNVALSTPSVQPPPTDKSSTNKTAGADTNSKTTSLSKLDQLQRLLNRKKSVLSEMVEFQEATAAESSNNQGQEATDSPRSKTDVTTDSVPDRVPPPGEQISSPPEKSNSKKSTPWASPLQLICQVLETWISSRTVQYLRPETSYAETPESSSDLQNKVGYFNLCRNLDEREKQLSNVLEEGIANSTEHEEDAVKATDDNKELKTAPDYAKLKEEAEQFQLKVTEFITGKRPKKESQKKDDPIEADVIIPTIDNYHQLQIRAKIVLEKLDRSLPDLLMPMGLSVQDISSLIRELVYTFRLERDTIIFKPAEWTIVSLLVLKMLSFKTKTLSTAFEKESAVQHFTVLLKGIKHKMEDLDSFTQAMLTNVTPEDRPD